MESKPLYGQLVIGPPGSGKTTYCFHVAEMLKDVFNRKLAIINLDPGNENMPFSAEIDVCDAVTVEDVMELENLGPNGGNFQWERRSACAIRQTVTEFLASSLTWVVRSSNK